MLRLYDTAIGSVEPLTLRRPGELSMYICGPTVYGEFHVGHGRACLVWDLLRRYAEWSGLAVRHVSNITDIDDKIIKRAHDEQTTADAVAKTWEAAWWGGMDRLGVARPHETPHATAYVEDMVGFIGELVDRGKAYVGGDGVYFASETVEDYGLLPHRSIGVLNAGESRLDVAEEAGKRSPIDFVLWKFAKPGEPSWPSPWGQGRPGWHTECVVMSLDLLGDDFDVHGGGVDLVFPHHEDERAQAVAAGNVFSRRWVHHEMVLADGGVKMSKSLSNYLSLAELLDAYDPRAYRLLALQTHYRKTMTVSGATMTAATKTLEGLDAFARELAAARGTPPDRAVLDRFRDRMDDDLDAPGAVAELFKAIREARAADPEPARAIAAAVFELWEVALGLPLDDGSGEIPPEAQRKAAERDEARAGSGLVRADQLRNELAAEGYVVEDTPAGTKLRPGPPVSFEGDTAVHRAGEGWAGEISPAWNVGDNPNGGYTLAMIARALLGESGRADPLSVTAHYVAPPRAGEVAITAETIRSGRRYATLGGAMRQGDKELIRVLGSFGDLSAMQGPTRVAAERPAVTPVEHCLDLAAASEAAGFRPPEVTRRYEVRLDPGTQWVRARAAYRARRRAGEAPAPEETEAGLLEPLEVAGWIRFADGAEPSTLGLLAMSDAFPPTMLGYQNVVWIPTIELTAHVRARPAPGWILGVFRTRLLVDGLLEEDGELWDSEGRLVALSRQLALVLS